MTAPRCGARLPGLRAGRHKHCRRPATPGHPSGRCALHGAKATGPVTETGMVNTLAAMKAGRARWLAARKAAGLPLTMGRKRGGKNRSLEERAASERHVEERRSQRAAMIKLNDLRKSEKLGRRQQLDEAAELERRHARFKSGGSFWDNADPSPADAPGAAPDLHEPAPPAATPETPVAPTVQDAGDIDALLDEFVTAPGARKADIKLAAAALVRLEKTFIARLADYQRPLPRDKATQLYRRIRQHELSFGRVDGREERLAKLAQALLDFEKKHAVRQTLAIVGNYRTEGRSPRRRPSG